LWDSTYQLSWSRRASATADKLKPTDEIGLEPVVYTAPETVRNPQSLQQCHVVDGIECSGQVKECQSSKISTVHCTENVSQNQNRYIAMKLIDVLLDVLPKAGLLI